uniref:Uncharacterized protein n=1 Tax=Arthrobacter sp. J3.49 TaxID=347213 RepID=I3W1R5_9MICC|nr:hypothetical protein [Arthrobacter sp. J3.49]
MQRIKSEELAFSDVTTAIFTENGQLPPFWQTSGFWKVGALRNTESE